MTRHILLKTFIVLLPTNLCVKLEPANAFIIALPIMGTLLLISVSMGILSKAAPQMNLMSEGFPIMILTTFFVITVIMPQLFDYFSSAFYSSFSKIQEVFATISKNGGAI